MNSRSRPHHLAFQVLALVFLSCVFIQRGAEVDGFKQELWLYQGDSNGLYFQSHVSDAAVYSLVLKNVNRFCATGIWYIFREVDFHKPLFLNGLGLPFTQNMTCGSVSLGDAKSFRFWGANDTSIPALSLYTEDIYGGEEILVTGTAYAGITQEIKSLAVTGSTDWTLFEGSHLDGNSICYTVPVAAGYYFNFNRVKDLSIGKIGSVFRGCDLGEANSYRGSLL